MNRRWQIAQFFEIRWWKRYLGDKDKTVYLQWKRAYWQDFLLKCGIAVAPGQTVLDAGCGPAGIFIILENQVVDALDPLLEQYEKQLPHFSRTDYPYVRFLPDLLENLDENARYDTIFCLNAINHVADIGAALRRLAAAAKPGATLLISTDAHRFAGLRLLFSWVPGDILHPHQYTEAAYRQLLEQNGWQVQQRTLIKREAIFDYVAFQAVCGAYY